MLTANQIDVLRSHSEQLLDPIVDFLIEDIARRISEAGQLTGTAAYQIWRAQNLGISQKQLMKEIQKRLKVPMNDVENMLTQAAEKSYNADIYRFPTKKAIPFTANSGLQQILDATVRQAKEDLLNMTQTIGFVGPDGNVRELTQAYQQACDFAFQKISAGAQDYVLAVREATANLAKKGIRTIDYESGVHTSLESAVRRNIMGGMGIMQEQISKHNHDSLGCNGWEISAHSGSAPDHEPIQGKQYSDKEYTNLNNSLVRRIGTLNCGHAAFPIILGVNSPQYTPEELEDMRRENEDGVTFEGKHYTLYEATQRQRKFERAIRDRKRRILIDETVGDKDKLQNDQIRLQVLKQEYTRFSKGVGLPMQHARMEKAGFDWKKGKAAEKTALEVAKANAQKYDKFDISENGRYKVLPYTTVDEYQAYIQPEYDSQKITKTDKESLWAKDGGYIRNTIGYKDINSYMRGLKPNLDNPKSHKTIDALVRTTSDNALKRDYVGFRKVSPSYLRDVLGIDTDGALKAAGMPWEGIKDFKTAKKLSSAINELVGTDRAYTTDKAGTSVSLCEGINFFTHRPVKFEIQMPAGTKGLITSNYKESEFIARPKTTLEILGSKVYNYKDKPGITIYARMLQD